MSKIQRDKGDLENSLNQQLELLHNSCRYYDSGTEIEALRIAASLRILLHDTNNSKSLLGQLNKKNNFIDTSYAIPEPIVRPEEKGKRSKSRRLFVQSLSPRIYAPLFNEGLDGSRILNFYDWWEKVVILSDDLNNTFSRKSLVLSIANQDGGSHVDPKLEKKYYDLTRKHSHGLGHGVTDSLFKIQKFQQTSPHLVTIRQIGHEVLKSLNPLYDYDGRQYYQGLISYGTQIVFTPDKKSETDKDIK